MPWKGREIERERKGINGNESASSLYENPCGFFSLYVSYSFNRNFGLLFADHSFDLRSEKRREPANPSL